MAAATAAAETLCHPSKPAEPPWDRAGSPTIRTEGETAASIPEPGAGMPPPQLHGRLRALRAKAERNGLVPAAVPGLVPAARPFAVPLGSLPVRVRALADWMNESFNPESLFVADDLGQPLVEFRGGADLLAAAAVLAEAAAKARRHLPGLQGAAVVHLTLGPGQVLSLVTASTEVGRWHAGLTMPLPLAEQAALELAASLRTAAAGT